MNSKKVNKFKRLVITTGALLLLAGSPIVQNNSLGEYMNTMTGTITAQAAELPYSANWETQADGSWKYKLTSGGYAVGWIQDEVDHNWYYMNSSQVMLSGLVKSDGGRVYLLSQDHDGHLGRMLENGQTYHGITIQADTSETYRGALSSETINQLKHIGLYVDAAPDVSGSQHTTNGQTTPAGGGNQTSTNNQSSTNQTSTSNNDYDETTLPGYGSDRGGEIGKGAGNDNSGGYTKWN